jgi:hypothetical protein
MVIDSLVLRGRPTDPNWDNALKHPVAWMFDGKKMFSCDRIWRPWYHCRFT